MANAMDDTIILSIEEYDEMEEKLDTANARIKELESYKTDWQSIAGKANLKGLVARNDELKKKLADLEDTKIALNTQIDVLETDKEAAFLRVRELELDKCSLEKKLVEAVVALEFYGDVESWNLQHPNPSKGEARMIVSRDTYKNETANRIFGGAKARQALLKIKAVKEN